MGNRRKSATNFGGTRKRGAPSRRPSLPQMLARMSTRECARRAAHAGKLKHALARLRAELQEMNADVAAVQVTCAADGETTNLGVDDCAPLPFPVSPSITHPQSPVLANNTTSLPSPSSILSPINNNSNIDNNNIPPGPSQLHSQMSDDVLLLSRQPEPMADVDAPPGFGPPRPFKHTNNGYYVAAPDRKILPVEQPTPVLLPPTTIIASAQEEEEAIIPGRKSSLPCGTYARESRNSYCSSLSPSIRPVRDAQTAYARELYASRSAPKYVPVQLLGCTAGKQHQFIPSTTNTASTNTTAARVPSPSGPHIRSFTPLSPDDFVSTQPSTASSSRLFTSFSSSSSTRKSTKDSSMQLPILSDIPTCIVGPNMSTLPPRSNRYNNSNNRPPLQQKCAPQERYTTPPVVLPPTPPVIKSYVGGDSTTIPKVIIGSISTQAIPTVISGIPPPPLGTTNTTTPAAASRRSFGRDGGMSNSNSRRSFGRLPLFTRSNTSAASSSSNITLPPVAPQVPIINTPIAVAPTTTGSSSSTSASSESSDISTSSQYQQQPSPHIIIDSSSSHVPLSTE